MDGALTSVVPAASDSQSLIASRLFRISRLLVGGALIGAALLKFGTPPAPWFTLWVANPSSLWLLVVCLELLLGTLIIGQVWDVVAWPTAAVFYAALGSVALALTLEGEHNCNCAGRIPLHPGYAAAFDWIIVVGILATAIGRPLHIATGLCASAKIGRVRFGALVVVGILAGGTLVWRIAAGELTLTPEPWRAAVALDRESVWLGDVATGEVARFDVGVRNKSARAVTVFGVECSPYVEMHRSLPVTIPAGELRQLSGTFLTYGKSKGIFAVRFQLLTDDRREPLLKGVVAARITGASSGGM